MFELFENIREEASQRSRRIVYTQSLEATVLEGVAAVSRNRIAHPLLLGDAAQIKKAGLAAGLGLGNVEVIGRDSRKLFKYAELCLPEWKAQGVNEVEAMARLENAVEFAVAMVRAGDADGVVAGPVSGRSNGERGLTRATGLGINRTAFSQCFLVFSGEAGRREGFLLANPATAGSPSAQQLAEIAIGAAKQTCRLLAVEPHVAFLSITATASLQGRNRFKSAEDALGERVSSAIQTIRVREESLALETGLWRGVRWGPGVASGRPGRARPKRPNTFVFAEEQAAGLDHRLHRLFHDSRTVGPIFDGLAQPANELEMGCDVEDVVNITAITSLG